MFNQAMFSSAPRSLSALLFAAFIALVPACDQRSDTSVPADATAAAQKPSLRPIKLQLNWVAEPEFGGFYAAQERGLFESEGIAMEMVQGGPDVPTAQLVASGKVDFAIVAGTQAIELNEQGGDLVAIYAVFQSNPMGVMVHESSPYQSLMALWESDSTLSIQDGLADFKWLNARFPGGKRKIVPYTSNLAQFAAQPTLASQCFVPSEPVALELQGIKTRVFLMNEAGFDPYNCVVVTTRGFLKENGDLCRRFVRASAAGWRAYLNDAGPTNQAMARLNPAMKIEAMDRGAVIQRPLIENDETKRIGLGGMRYARWEEMVNQSVELALIKKKPDPQSLFFWDTEAGSAR